jgi:hypothetical protein
VYLPELLVQASGKTDAVDDLIIFDELLALLLLPILPVYQTSFHDK